MLVAAQCKELVRTFGWQLADFLRTLICIGGVFDFVSTESPEREKESTAASVIKKWLRLDEAEAIEHDETVHKRYLEYFERIWSKLRGHETY